MNEKEFKSWAFVKPETHTESYCTCPECGAGFFLWFENHHTDDEDSIQKNSLCTHCLEELDEESEEEEESF
tara:strand:- start:3970 stop:4182 length:213 start_codon:yes stop_codon:yes gene_type:complete